MKIKNHTLVKDHIHHSAEAEATLMIHQAHQINIERKKLQKM